MKEEGRRRKEGGKKEGRRRKGEEKEECSRMEGGRISIRTKKG